LPTVASPNSAQALDRLQSAERAAIEHSLVEADYNCNRAAKRLGISRATLYRKIGKYNIPLRRP
jgi:transcriptional regulator with PAS, ATPase and Fis domain